MALYAKAYQGADPKSGKEFMYYPDNFRAEPPTQLQVVTRMIPFEASELTIYVLARPVVESYLYDVHIGDEVRSVSGLVLSDGTEIRVYLSHLDNREWDRWQK